MSAPRKLWLEGFYPPEMEDFVVWSNDWSFGPHAEKSWVRVKGDYYTEDEARNVLREKPHGVCEGPDDVF